jgi:FKBP-type peptidyl-prolyl cis-trans isomerase FklB
VPGPQSAATTQEQLLKGANMSPKQRAELAKAAQASTNNDVGANFLASNKSKPGVISLPSGVQYKILKAGNGKRPTDDSVVRCRYQGTLVDGATFDKADDKTPVVMRVAGFLTGLKEAVKLMSSGSKWEVVVPPQLGYGSHGSRGVAPNAVLIYTIEILGVN